MNYWIVSYQCTAEVARIYGYRINTKGVLTIAEGCPKYKVDVSHLVNNGLLSLS